MKQITNCVGQQDKSLGRRKVLACGAGVAAAVLGSTVLAGCSNAVHGQSPANTPCAYIAVDRSGSTDALLLRYKGLIDAAAASMPRGSLVKLFRFDREAVEFYEGRPRTPKELWAAQDKDLPASVEAKITRPDAFFEQMVRELPYRPEERIAVIVISDGENGGRDLTPYAKVLAADERICAVWFVGLKSQFREPIRQQFQALGDRLVRSGLTDVESGLAEFKALISKPHRVKSEDGR